MSSRQSFDAIPAGDSPSRRPFDAKYVKTSREVLGYDPSGPMPGRPFYIRWGTAVTYYALEEWDENIKLMQELRGRMVPGTR